MVKFVTIFSLILALNAGASVYSQNNSISLDMKSSNLTEVFKEIQKQTSLTFLYSNELLKNTKPVDITAKNTAIVDILKECLKGTNLGFEIQNNVILIKRLKAKQQQQQKIIVVQGKVTDKKGNPIPGATVRIKGTNYGTATNVDGLFSIESKIYEGSIIVSFIGYTPKTVDYKGNLKFLKVQLEENVTELEDVVVTGYSQINKESYTGNATVVKGEDLAAVGTQNLLKSLGQVVAGLNILENNELGSDPNSLPQIRLHGEAVFTTPGFDNLNRASLEGDPNSPVFIMDNFEVKLEKVLDLDMTRIESVTVLKDAAATAVYGSRAANGVIVIKTKQPEQGELSLTYNMNADIYIPDLSSYDLLNAEELFDLQKNLGMRPYIGNRQYQTLAIERYIGQGVDTDWLAQPTRSAVGHKHSLNIMGGDNNIRYMLDVNHSNKPGVMKGSSRKTSGIGLTLSYNMNDKIVFRNRLSVDNNKSANSPYGSFDTYAKMPSYFPIRDITTGNTVEKYLYEGKDFIKQFGFHNPIHEANVGNLDESSYKDITNNFSIDWRINTYLRLRSNISYFNKNIDSEYFISPDSYMYWNTEDDDDRGYYRYTQNNIEKYEGSAILTLLKQYSKHFFNVSVGFNASESKSFLKGFTAQGFAARGLSDPAFAAGYEKGAAPISVEETSRLIGLLATANYSYDDKYLMDFSYRLDGSSKFGTEKQFAPFFGLGLGWNIHNEEFFRGSSIINRLKLKGSLGETGSVNFAAYQARNTLQYYNQLRYHGTIGAFVKALGNEDLRWQTTKKMNLGLEFSIFDRRIDASFDMYKDRTSDMVTPITIPPSMGFNSYVENLGQMENKGYDFNLRAKIINKKDMRLSVYFNGTHNSSKILSISNSLKSYNDFSDNSGYSDDEVGSGFVENEDGSTTPVNQEKASHDFLVRFEPGVSNTAIWAVRSLGIDPMTGKEWFLTKDGKPTLVWNPDDKVVVGDTEADLRGSIGATFSYKGFDLTLGFMYSFGGQSYNHTLVNRIENSSKENNVDRRVYSDTWMKPGDVVKFKSNYSSLGYMNETTGASSRFVQDNNYLTLSTVNINYNIPSEICKKLRMKSLKLNMNMNDIFHLSSIERERGFSYPFARVISFGLRSNF